MLPYGLGCGMLCATTAMEDLTQYAVTVIDPATCNVRTIVVAAVDAFAAYHKCKQLCNNHPILRITYA